MKNKQNILKNLIYLLSVTLLFFSCDSEIEPNIVQESKYTVEKISYKTFEQNKAATSKFCKLNTKGTVLAKNSYDSGLGFTIETDSLKYVENTITGVHSYNFPIIRDSLASNNLENLVLQSNANGDYDAFIVEYGFSIEDYNQLDEQFLSSTTTNYTPIDFDSSLLDNYLAKSTDGWSCVEIWVLTKVANDEGNLNGDTPLWTWEWILESSACTYSGGGGGGSSWNGPGNGSGSTGGSFGGGSGSTTGSGSNPVVSAPTTPTNPDGTSAAPSFLINALTNHPSYSTQIERWINSSDNIDIVHLLLNIVTDNNMALEAKNLVIAYIILDIDLDESIVDDSPSPQNNYSAAVQHLVDFLRLYGEIEHEIIADYYESLIEDFNDMTMGEVHDIYLSIKVIADAIPMDYFNAILDIYVSDLIMPMVSYALFNAATNTAIKLLQKIPLPAVLVGTRLNKLLRKVAQLGNPGIQGPHIRELHGTSVSKAQELFSTLIKNAVSTSNPNSYTTVANMGNGNYITFRTYSGGLSEGVIATIDINFSSLFSNIVKLKFYP